MVIRENMAETVLKLQEYNNKSSYDSTYYHDFWKTSAEFAIDFKAKGVCSSNQSLMYLSSMRNVCSESVISDYVDSDQVQIVLDYLQCCLESRNKFVVFSCSKTLVSMLAKSSCTIILDKMVPVLIEVFLNWKENTTAAIYALQTNTEFMKSCRTGSMLDISTERKLHHYLSLLSLHKQKIIDAVTAVSFCNDINTTMLISEQCLSLCSECCRVCRILRDEKIETFLLLCLHVLVKTVGTFPLSFCHIRITDFMKKMLGLVSTDQSQLIAQVISLDDFKSFQSIAMASIANWFARESTGVYNQLFSQIIVSEDKGLDSINCHLEDVFVRKYLLLMLNIFVLHLDDAAMCQPVIDFICLLQKLSSQNFTNKISDADLPFFLSKLIFHLISEQDNNLVATLSVLLKLYTISLPKLQHLLIETLNVHTFVVLFLQSIGFDSTTILDFVVSNETSFDLFLCNYLQLISQEAAGDDLSLVCSKLDSLLLNKSEHRKSAANIKKKTDQSESLNKFIELLSALYTKLDYVKENQLVNDKKMTTIDKILIQIEKMAI